MALTTAELTILGLLAERPAHGYDLERVIEQRGVRRWTDIGFSSIYYLLAKLEKRGHIQGATPVAGRRSRRVFTLTAAGRRAAGDETAARLAEPEPVGGSFLTALANRSLLGEEAVLHALRNRLVRLDAQLAAVQRTRRESEGLPAPAREVFSYSVGLMEAERAWLATRVQGDDG